MRILKARLAKLNEAMRRARRLNYKTNDELERKLQQITQILHDARRPGALEYITAQAARIRELLNRARARREIAEKPL